MSTEHPSQTQQQNQSEQSPGQKSGGKPKRAVSLLMWAAALVLTLFESGRKRSAKSDDGTRSEPPQDRQSPAPKPEAEEQLLKQQAQQYISRFREVAKSAVKITLLWAAALAIVWLTGIERTQRDLNNNLAEIRQLNQDKQELEKQVIESYKSDRDAYLQLATDAEHIEDAQKLPQLIKELAAAQRARDIDGADFRRRQIVNIETRLNISVNNTEEELQKLEHLLQERKAKLARESEVLKAKVERLQERKKGIGEKQGQIQQKIQEIRSQRKGVSFDILGQRFEVPPVYAPLMWNVFLLALLLYLARARSTLLTLSVRALSALRSVSSLPPTALKNILVEAPWWLAPLPGFTRSRPALSAGQDNAPASIRPQEIRDAYGWSQIYHRIIGLLSTVCLFVLVTSQMRVIWLGFALSRQLGDSYERALVPLVLILIIIVTSYSVWLWFNPDYVPAPEQEGSEKPIKWQLILLGLFLLILLSVAALTFSRLEIGMRVGHDAQPALFFIFLYLALALIVFCAYQWSRPEPGRSPAGEQKPESLARRRFVFGGVWVVCATGLTLFLYGKLRATHRTPTRRLARLRRPKTTGPLGLERGFYQNSKSKIIYYVTDKGILAGVKASEFAPDKSHLQLFEPLLLPRRTRAGRNKWEQREDEANDADVRSGADVSKVAGSRPAPQSGSQAGITLKSDAGAAASEKTAGQEALLKKKPAPGAQNFFAAETSALLSTGALKADTRGQQRKPRVCLSGASHAFEQAAAFILQGTELRKKDYNRACELLIYAINHDIDLKNQTGGVPSFRLYDLLAGLSVRYDCREHFDELLRLVDEFGQSTLFQERKAQWQNPDSSWHKRWSDPHRNVRWAQLQLGQP
jgi:hypothetical protein